MKQLISVLMVTLISVGSWAQDNRLVLLDGTPVKLRTTENLSSHDAVKGGDVSFEITEDVYVNNTLVATKGSSAIGTITDAEHKKTMGRGGKLDITINYMRLLNGEKAQLRGSREGKAGGHTGAMVGAMVVTSLVIWPAAPLFLFMHGKDINIPRGTAIMAYVDGDFEIGRAKARTISVLQQPAQEEVQVPAATVPTQVTTATPASTPVLVQTVMPAQTGFVPEGEGVSLGEAARIAKQRTACLRLAADNPSITCK